MKKLQVYLIVLMASLFLLISIEGVYAQENVGVINKYTKKLDLNAYPEIQDFIGNEEQPFGKLNPAAPIETKQFGKLAGVWEAVDTALVDGKWQCCWRAVWAFKYTANGFGIQDYYLQLKKDFPPPSKEKVRDSHLNLLRVYSPKDKIWNIAQISNGGKESGNSNFVTYTAKLKNKELIMLPNGNPGVRVVFFEIKKDSFKWRFDISNNKGKTWKTVFLILAKRISL